eukprot:m.163434 g.163434  ORF g.163434 m.163434 type:complete len:116 (+) comp14385_c0_seq1:193-540(+)
MPPRKAKARFATSGIKRIMQADDEVGRVSQAALIIVSRVVEEFVKDAVGTAAANVQAEQGHTVHPGHIKQVVAATSEFDFLQPTVAKYPDPPLPGDDKKKKKRAGKRAHAEAKQE